LNSGTVQTVGTVDVSNDMYIPSTAKTSRGLLYVVTAGTGGTITIAAGDNSPAGRSGLGSLSIIIGLNTTRYIPLESARFMQSDGTINVDLADMNASNIAFIQLPDGL
jgi:hypothetical protein